MNNNYQKELIKGLVLLFIVVVGFSIAIRTFTKGENLYDYAEKNNIPIHTEKEIDNNNK